MSNPLTEKCNACMIGMTFTKDGLSFSKRICCTANKDEPCEIYTDRVKAYDDGFSQLNPCFYCSKYEHCSNQLKCGFLS